MHTVQIFQYAVKCCNQLIGNRVIEALALYCNLMGSEAVLGFPMDVNLMLCSRFASQYNIMLVIDVFLIVSNVDLHKIALDNELICLVLH